LSIILAVICVGPDGVVAASSHAADGGDSSDAFSEYTVGVFLLEGNAASRAIPHLENAWSLSDNDAVIGHALAEAYYRVGDLDNCSVVLDKLIAADDKDGEALLLHAKVLSMSGRVDEALVVLQQLRKIGGPSFEVERLAGRILFELGRDEEALVAYENAVRLGAGYPFLHHRYGLLLRKFGRTEEAEHAFRTAVELFPEFSDAVIDLASILIQQNRLVEAQTALTKLLERAGQPAAEALMMSANLHAEMGKPEKAIELLENRATRLPRDGAVMLGRLYYDTARYEDSFDIFKGLYEEEPSSELARVLAEVSLKAEHPERALGYYRRAIEIDPANFRNYMALFFVSSKQFAGDDPMIDLPPAEAEDLLNSAASHVIDDDFDGLYVVGVAYQAIDDYETSGKMLERALQLEPEDERVLLNLAGVMEHLGRYEDAERYLVRLYQLTPDDPRVCNFYGYLLALMNRDLDKAEALIQTALRHEPDNGYYVDSLGWVYFVRGEYEQAVETLQRASRLAGDDPVIYEHLGDAYRSVKMFRKALAAYEKTLELRGESPDVLEKLEAARRQLGD
jgi:tetratricopeptide (TPR) repeat protein